MKGNGLVKPVRFFSRKDGLSGRETPQKRGDEKEKKARETEKIFVKIKNLTKCSI